MVHPGGLRAGVLWSARVICHITASNRTGSTDWFWNSLDCLEAVLILRFSASSALIPVGLFCHVWDSHPGRADISYSSEAIISPFSFVTSPCITSKYMHIHRALHICPHATNASISHLGCSTDDDASIFTRQRFLWKWTSIPGTVGQKKSFWGLLMCLLSLSARPNKVLAAAARWASENH